MRTLLVWIATAAGIAAMTPAASACVTVTPSLPAKIVYDAESPYPNREKLRLVVRATRGCGEEARDGAGVLAVSFAKRVGHDMRFQIVGRNRNLLFESIPAAEPEILDLRDTDTTVLEFAILVDRGQRVTSGLLEFDLVYRRLDPACATLACQTPELDEIVPLSLSVEPKSVFRLSLAGASRGRVDFGELTTGKSARVSLSATASTPYRIAFESQNGGLLVLDGGSAEKLEERVPYAMRLNGAAVSEDVPYESTSLFGTGGVASDVGLALTVGDAGGKRAGKYRDVLTIRIEPMMSGIAGGSGS